jgi:hypothetical protein
MSTTTIAAGARFDRAGVDERPSLGRLTVVELRKMLDTRAGLWLPLGVLALTLVTVVATGLTSHAHDHTLRHILGNALQPAAILLPVVGVLLVTSEWTRRTALTTFTLVPDRMRMMSAKLAASVLLAIVPLAVAVLLSVLGTAIASAAVSGAWRLPASLLPQALVYLATSMLTGVAFGAVFLSSAPAIVAYFALPTALGALSSAVHARSVFQWIDGSLSLDPLAHHPMSGAEWLHALSTLALWMFLPLVIGLWRVAKSEIK